MSTYLVTGAAGFIGAKVCEFLLAEGHTVVGIDNLNDYYDVRLKDYRLAGLLGQRALRPENLSPGDLKSDAWRPGGDSRVSMYAGKWRLDSMQAPNLTIGSPQPKSESGFFIFEQIDIENLPALDRLFGQFKFDAVFNLAARAGVRYSMENPHVYLSTNTLGTLNLLECQRKHGVKKQVLASTSSLYAGCAMPFTEDLPVNTPLSPYAATKKGAELMAYSYHKLYGLDTTVVRYFTVFGPAGRPDMSIFRFIKWIDEDKPLELFGDGSQSRDFTYVDDVARGTIAAGKLRGYDGARERGDGVTAGHAPEPREGVAAGGDLEGVSGYNVINIGGGRNPISLQTVIAYIEKAFGKKAKIAGKPFHVADIKETWADITKAGRLLGWKPEIAPEEGFRRCVEWHIANRDWLKGIEL